MAEDPLAALGEQYRQAKKRHEAAKRAAKKADEKRVAEASALDAVRESMRGAIVEAGHARRRPVEIAKLTGYGPEMVRQILRAAGVEPFERESPT